MTDGQIGGPPNAGECFPLPGYSGRLCEGLCSDGAVLCHQIATLGPLFITEQGQMEDQNPLSLGPREFGKVT